ncbi:hypothetical protein pb186bvf_007231 [Paramecium bursaria]
MITNSFLNDTKQLEIIYSQEKDCLQLVPNNLIQINLKQSYEKQIIENRIIVLAK